MWPVKLVIILLLSCFTVNNFANVQQAVKQQNSNIVDDESIDALMLIFNKSIGKENYFIFNDEWFKVKDDWNQIGVLIKTKLHFYYQLVFNIIKNPKTLLTYSEIDMSKINIIGFRHLLEEKQLIVNLEYGNSKYYDFSFIILKNNENYYANNWNLEVKRTIEKEILKTVYVEKDIMNNWGKIEQYWFSVILPKIYNLLAKINNKLLFKEETFYFRNYFFTFEGITYEKTNSFIGFNYHYNLLLNNLLEIKVKLSD